MQIVYGLALCAVTASAALAQQAAHSSAYTAHAQIGFLPGNPYWNRLYSLQRAVVNDKLYDAIAASELVRDPKGRVYIAGGSDAEIRVGFIHDDFEVAKGAVGVIIYALREKMALRKRKEPAYGDVAIVSSAKPATVYKRKAAEAILRLTGITWNADDRQAFFESVTGVRAGLTSPEFLRSVLRMSGLQGKTQVAELQSALSIEMLNTPLLQVRLKSTDPRWQALLATMVSYLNKPELRMNGQSEQDLDFVPRHMRRAHYVFNCCTFR